MPKEFPIEEKIYNKILLLQANDDFMADVLALRKKCNDAPATEVQIGDNEYDYIFYNETRDYKDNVKELMKKHNLSDIFFKHLEVYISSNELIASTVA